MAMAMANSVALADEDAILLEVVVAEEDGVFMVVLVAERVWHT
jgi:hypothetical protein